jgi:hypothetical protein
MSFLGPLPRVEDIGMDLNGALAWLLAAPKVDRFELTATNTDGKQSYRAIVYRPRAWWGFVHTLAETPSLAVFSLVGQLKACIADEEKRP